MTRSVGPRLLAITDLSLRSADEHCVRLRRLAENATAGSVALLLRDHAASGRERLALGERLRDIARASGQQLWVADRLDLALLLAADGVHLGEASVSASAARRLVGEGVQVSRAWHALGFEDDTELEHVDALLVSPVMAPRKGRAALGAAALEVLGAQLRARNPAYPQAMYALGGVTHENAAACLAAGAFGVAAIGAPLGDAALALLDALAIRR